MVSSQKKKFVKRTSKIIIIIFLLFVFSSAIATKFIYDFMFLRYERQADIPSSLSSLIEERQKIKYMSSDNILQGYLYHNRGDTMVVIAPGFHAGGDDYIQQIKALLDYGYGVFAFDSTGSGESQGESCVGFPQELCDLNATLDYIEDNDKFGYRNIVLFGHSRGGYAVCCVLGYSHDISAVVSVAGINSAMEGIMEPSVDMVGPIAYSNYPFLWIYQSILFGVDVVNKNAVDEISSSSVPVLVIHGENDETVSKDEYSIYSHRQEIKSDNVEFFLCDEPGRDGHTNLLFDKDNTANDKLMDKINDFYVDSIRGK